MPSWLKKRFQVLKRDLISHLVAGKSQKQLPACGDNSNNERITNNASSPIRKIRNDLKAHRFCNKTDMNAYHDYTKWRDQVLINQNNCALRCIKEEKINNIDNAESVDGDSVTNQVGCTKTNETRPYKLNHCDDEATPKDANTTKCNDANCDSESEFYFDLQNENTTCTWSNSLSGIFFAFLLAVFATYRLFGELFALFRNFVEFLSVFFSPCDWSFFCVSTKCCALKKKLNKFFFVQSDIFYLHWINIFFSLLFLFFQVEYIRLWYRK